MTREEHLLTSMAEECCEVAHRISKALKFGLDEVQEGQTETNAERIVNECADLAGVYEMLVEDQHIKNIDAYKVIEKKAKVEKYLKYSKGLGKLEQ